ncbi:MAG: hypothetical protein USCAAHI_01130 [Beijerinckiaceae bacterium]|nr:MAG: hypothetical protein USCAAHI_01130 [Beijerinckiaceae bacterium]
MNKKRLKPLPVLRRGFKSKELTMNGPAHKDGLISLPLVFCARAPRSGTYASQDRPMRFGWNRRNGTSRKPSRHI